MTNLYSPAHCIIYHQVKPGLDCPDGICAAWVAHQAYPQARILGCSFEPQHRRTQLASLDFDVLNKLTLVDFSFPSQIIERLLNKGIELEIIDHHVTAWNELSSLRPNLLFDYDLNECGATLAWKHFFESQPLPVFLEYVRDRDLWDFLLPETPVVHEALCALGRRFALLDRLSLMNREELLWFLKPIGEPLIRPKVEAIDAAAARVEWGKVAAYDHIPFVRVTSSEERLISEICMTLYRRYPDALFSACVTEDGRWSLRSDKHGNNTDVGAIAQALGGGGHHNASGFVESLSL